MYHRIPFFFLALASISYTTSTHSLNWDIGHQFCFLAYFLVGYSIKRKTDVKRDSVKGIVYIMCGFAINILLAVLNCQRALHGVDIDVKLNNILGYGPLSPIEVIASLFIFAGFANLTIKYDFSKLSSYTFLIYLIHAGVWDVMTMLLARSGCMLDSRIEIMLSIGIVFLTSWLFAVVCRRAWRSMNRRFSVTKKICYLCRLDRCVEAKTD